jgi:hypothetical protein
MIMKKKFITLSILTLLLFQSCSITVRIPITKSEQKLHDGAKKVRPQFIVKEHRNTGVLITALVVGGLSSYFLAGLSKEGGKKGIDMSVTKASLLGFGLGAGATIAVLGPFSGDPRTEKSIIDVPDSQFDKWLYKYSSKEGISYSKYGQDSYSYLIVPKSNIYAYEAEEKRLKSEGKVVEIDLAEQRFKEKEEKNRIAKENANIQAELAAYEKVKKSFMGNADWLNYLEKFPNGLHKNEVLSKAEEIVFKAAALHENSACAFYLEKFPQGKYSNVLKKFEFMVEKWDSLKTASSENAVFPYPNYESNVQLKEAINSFSLEFTKYADDIKNIANFNSDELTYLEKFKEESKANITKELTLIETEIKKGNEKIEKAKKFMFGDNLCLNLLSSAINQQGNEIKGMKLKTIIKVYIVEFREDKKNVKITINEIFNVNLNKQKDTFSFDKTNKVWTKGTQEWINLADWDLDICK